MVLFQNIRDWFKKGYHSHRNQDVGTHTSTWKVLHLLIATLDMSLQLAIIQVPENLRVDDVPFFTLSQIIVEWFIACPVTTPRQRANQ